MISDLVALLLLLCVYVYLIAGVEVIADPRSLAAAGKAAQVPVMLGFNADEGESAESRKRSIT